VGLVVFKDDHASLELAPTSSISLARMYLEKLSTGGSTPLCHGLALGHEVISRELARNPALFPVMVVITDGNGNVGIKTDDPLSESLRLGRDLRDAGIASLVIDTGTGSPDALQGPYRASPARRVAEAMAADYFAMQPLDQQGLMARVSSKLG
jgi:magnesium chelatase subunit D